MEDRPKYAMEILWRKTEEGVRIDRIFSQETFVRVPDFIEGNLVTELGPYCFSSSEKYNLVDGILTSIDKWGESKNRITEPSLPQAAGKYLEGVILPDSLIKLSNGAFYNCRNMTSLSMGMKLNNLGSDVFTNCGKLSKIIIRGNAKEPSGLPLILERIKTEVEVFFQPEEEVTDCRLFFPECYEWFDDMVTAHVFNRVIVGEGFRMRQCFHDHQIQFSKYDQCLANSVKLEGDVDICRIAMNRLRWPVNLKEEYELVYSKAIEERFDEMIKLIIFHRNLEELKFLCSYFKPEGAYLTRWMEACIYADWIEGNVYLMEEKQKGKTFAEKTFDFDDF